MLTAGLINWDYYYVGSAGASVSTLVSDGNYPNAPMTNTDFTAFDSDQITGGDLNNNAPLAPSATTMATLSPAGLRRRCPETIRSSWTATMTANLI